MDQQSRVEKRADRLHSPKATKGFQFDQGRGCGVEQISTAQSFFFFFLLALRHSKLRLTD